MDRRGGNAEVLKGETKGFKGTEGKVKGEKKEEGEVRNGVRQVLEGIEEERWSLREETASESFCGRNVFLFLCTKP